MCASSSVQCVCWATPASSARASPRAVRPGAAGVQVGESALQVSLAAQSTAAPVAPPARADSRVELAPPAVTRRRPGLARAPSCAATPRAACRRRSSTGSVSSAASASVACCSRCLRGLQLPVYRAKSRCRASVNLTLAQFALQVRATLRDLRLLPQGVQPGLDFRRQVSQALQIPPRLGQDGARPGRGGRSSAPPRRLLPERPAGLPVAAARPARPGPG